MSVAASSPKNQFLLEKRQLLYWISQWSSEEADLENINLDMPAMSLLLQSMGFRLESFEKSVDIPMPNNDQNQNFAIRIEIVCQKSGMKSTMVKETSTCKCPSEEDVSRSQFWTVTACGSGVSPQNPITTSRTTLLPKITEAKSLIIERLLSKVLSVINETDYSKTESSSDLLKPSDSMLIRHRSLDTLRNKEDSLSTPRGLKRRPSWEVDPKTTPPTDTSSPNMPKLCDALNQVSLESSGRYAKIMITNLETIKQLVHETLEIASGTNTTFVKVPAKRVSDIIASPKDSSRKKITKTPVLRRLPTPKKVLSANTKVASRIAVGPKRTPVSQIGVAKNSSNLMKKESTMSPASSSPHIPAFRRTHQTANLLASGRSVGSSGIARVKTVSTRNIATLAKKK